MPSCESGGIELAHECLAERVRRHPVTRSRSRIGIGISLRHQLVVQRRAQRRLPFRPVWLDFNAPWQLLLARANRPTTTSGPTAAINPSRHNVIIADGIGLQRSTDSGQRFSIVTAPTPITTHPRPLRASVAIAFLDPAQLGKPPGPWLHGPPEIGSFSTRQSARRSAAPSRAAAHAPPVAMPSHRRARNELPPSHQQSPTAGSTTYPVGVACLALRP
jgi:hypothetical protein